MNLPFDPLLLLLDDDFYSYTILRILYRRARHDQNSYPLCRFLILFRLFAKRVTAEEDSERGIDIANLG